MIPLKLELCYTLRTMVSNQHIWLKWTNSIHRWGIHEELAVLLEAAGPLAVFGAQLVYLGQPLLSRLVPDDELQALAQMLEDTNQTRSFASFLREGTAQ
jgi:hypothetical protein